MTITCSYLYLMTRHILISSQLQSCISWVLHNGQRVTILSQNTSLSTSLESSRVLCYLVDLLTSLVFHQKRWWCTQQNGKRVKSCEWANSMERTPPRIWHLVEFFSNSFLSSGSKVLEWTHPGSDILWKFLNSTLACTVQWCLQTCHKPFPHQLRAIWKC